MRVCAVPECFKKHKARGYCETHWDRLRTTGSLERFPRIRAYCSVVGCEEFARRWGFCSSHGTLAPQRVAYVARNRDVRLRGMKSWRERNPERFKAGIRSWTAANRDKVQGYWRAYNKTPGGKLRRVRNQNYRLGVALRIRLWFALKAQGASKSGSAVRDLGCTIPKLKAHLEAKFQPGMSWGNWGMKKGLHSWQIDHIRPLASFDLSDPEQVKQAIHYTNLQPLWAEENLRKGSKIPSGKMPLGAKT